MPNFEFESRGEQNIENGTQVSEWDVIEDVQFKNFITQASSGFILARKEEQYQINASLAAAAKAIVPETKDAARLAGGYRSFINLLNQNSIISLQEDPTGGLTHATLSREDLIICTSFIYARKQVSSELDIRNVPFLNSVERTIQLLGGHPVESILSQRIEKYSQELQDKHARPKEEKAPPVYPEVFYGVALGAMAHRDLADPESFYARLREIDIMWVKDKQKYVNDIINLDSVVASTGEFPWSKEGVDELVGRIVEFVRLANAHQLKSYRQKEVITPREIRDGLEKLEDYFKEYTKLPNLYVLFEAMRVRIREMQDDNGK